MSLRRAAAIAGIAELAPKRTTPGQTTLGMLASTSNTGFNTRRTRGRAYSER